MGGNEWGGIILLFNDVIKRLDYYKTSRIMMITLTTVTFS